jgi:hypothetical protein
VLICWSAAGASDPAMLSGIVYQFYDSNITDWDLLLIQP